MKEFKNDIDLLWHNCYKFNGPPNSKQPKLSAFSNFAVELQFILNEYLEQFNQILIKRGYITSSQSGILNLFMFE